MQPARLRWAQDSAGFAANRRTAINPDGPVDHSVPVLAIERRDGSLAGLLFGYACHNTTLPASFVSYHGDYAGVAKVELERRHPGVTALFIRAAAPRMTHPRGTIELGRTARTRAGRRRRCALGLASRIRARCGPLHQRVPGLRAGARRRRLAQEARDENVYVRRHAQMMLDTIARDGRIIAAEPAPRTPRRRPALVALSGGGRRLRVAIRKKYGDGTWVAGYTDSVFGYVPSARVLREGGYEGGDAMLYFGRPGPFAATVESTVIGGVDALMAATGARAVG
jgi:hypothetical protein